MRTESLTDEIFIGSKKVYVLDQIDKTPPVDEVRLLIDCKMCNGCGYLGVRLTGDQYLAYRARRIPLQEILPHLRDEVREALISGTTPLEWRDIFGLRDGDKPYTIGELKTMGYEFAEDDLADDTVFPPQSENDEPYDEDSARHLGDDVPENHQDLRTPPEK